MATLPLTANDRTLQPLGSPEVGPCGADPNSPALQDSWASEGGMEIGLRSDVLMGPGPEHAIPEAQ